MAATIARSPVTPAPAPGPATWTVADLHRRFGPIAFDRIRPDPGTATAADVVAIRERERRLCELVDGVLVTKTMGFYESYVAGLIAYHLSNSIRSRRLGIVLGADGMYHLSPVLVRIPDASFVSFDRLPGRRVPRVAICPIPPDLAVEVISPSNTRKEMETKREDYLRAGVRLVWYVDPDRESARWFDAAGGTGTVRRGGALDGADVVPGFVLPLATIFDDPTGEGPAD